MHIFISHSSKDAEIASRICDFLEEKGKCCFLAPRDIKPGREYAEELIDGIDQSEAMILIMSEHANRSPHVLREVERAVSKSIPILVYKLEEIKLSKSLEYFLMTHQWINAKPQEDFSDLWGAFFDRRSAGNTDMSGTTNTSGDSVAAGMPNGANSQKIKKPWLIPAIVLTLLTIGLGIFAFVRAAAPEPFVCPYEVGDTLSFGSYNGEVIEWRVLKLSEDKTQAVLVSKHILTMKAYDAAESGTYNKDGDKDYWFEQEVVDADLELQIRARGNSDWSTSNIRTWLNSADEVVAYTDQPPMSTAMAEKRNGYHNEPGFLYNFSEAERSAIVPTVNATPGNALSDEAVTTTDMVYLLSLSELTWFDEAGISKLAVPTDAAVAQDLSCWYYIDLTEFNIREYCWWLRTPAKDLSSACYMVGNGYTEDNIWERNVGLEGFGIRPAITVDLQAECFEADSTEE